MKITAKCLRNIRRQKLQSEIEKIAARTFTPKKYTVLIVKDDPTQHTCKTEKD